MQRVPFSSSYLMRYHQLRLSHFYAGVSSHLPDSQEWFSGADCFLTHHAFFLQIPLAFISQPFLIIIKEIKSPHKSLSWIRTGIRLLLLNKRSVWFLKRNLFFYKYEDEWKIIIVDEEGGSWRRRWWWRELLFKAVTMQMNLCCGCK